MDFPTTLWKGFPTLLEIPMHAFVLVMLPGGLQLHQRKTLCGTTSGDSFATNVRSKSETHHNEPPFGECDRSAQSSGPHVGTEHGNTMTIFEATKKSLFWREVVFLRNMDDNS